MRISQTTSTYLNLSRWLAASAVVLYHFQDKHFGPDWLTRHFPSNGHGYVIIFFVISGFVVSMTAEQKSAIQFAVDRSVRIYIVALPVLLICTLLSLYALDAPAEYSLSAAQPLFTLFLNATFLSQSWSLSYFPFLDAPYWSLSYEVMYYLIFGFFFYTRGPARWLTAPIVCIIAGPKILVLFPCWLAGVAAYRLRNKIKVSKMAGWIVVLAAPAILIIAFWIGLKNAADGLSDKFEFVKYTASDGFLRSWIVALAFSVHIWGICQIRIAFPKMIERAARQMADMSYSLYLLHLPVLYLLAYELGNRQSSVFVVIAIIAVFIICFLFSRITESNRVWLRQKLEDAIHQRGVGVAF